MVMADGGAQHLVLPVGIAMVVVGIVETVGLHVVADVIGSGDIELFGDVVESHITVVADIGALGLSTALGSDDDHTIGSLRTVDSGGCGIAEHVDALDIVGSHHGDVDTGNAIDDIVR